MVTLNIKYSPFSSQRSSFFLHVPSFLCHLCHCKFCGIVFEDLYFSVQLFVSHNYFVSWNRTGKSDSDECNCVWSMVAVLYKKSLLFFIFYLLHCSYLVITNWLVLFLFSNITNWLVLQVFLQTANMQSKNISQTKLIGRLR